MSKPALDHTESDDLVNLLCGKLLGEGQYRTVFACHLDKSWVVKKDTGTNFSNIAEWEMFSEFQDTPLAKWLAPVHWLSPRGLWLIQSKTEPIPRRLLPSKVPAVFADSKLENWGMLDGRVVCHDYGNNRVYRVAQKPAGRLVKVKEWK